MKAPVTSSADLVTVRDRLVDMRAELIVGLAHGELDVRRLPVVARIEAAIAVLDRSAHRIVVNAPPGEPIRLAFSSRNGTDATQIEIVCDRTGRIVATIDHWTDEPEGDETLSQQPKVEVGRNEGGDPTASCIDGPVPSLPKTRRPRTKLSPAQARAFELLGAAIKKAGVIPPANDHLPVNTQCVREDFWRSSCYAGQISDSDKPDACRRAFGRAAKALVAAGHVGKWQTWVWIMDYPAMIAHPPGG
jgi:hypothetical protein